MVSAERGPLLVAGVHSVRGEQVGEVPKNQTAKELLPGWTIVALSPKFKNKQNQKFIQL